MTDEQKIHLPRPTKLELKRFTLYSGKRKIVEEFDLGVYCLAGANGLGKSTFLTALTFGMTGIVPDPSRKFASVDEYYTHSVSFAEEFFSGRISESDRDEAELSIEFYVGDSFYQVTRGLFDSVTLRSFRIKKGGPNGEVDFDEPELAPKDLHEKYAKRLAQDVGIASFEQFVFLVHYVLTFDERRHLLFWDSKVLEQALYLAFGVDRADAAKADKLRRDMEKADSLARNSNWQASEVRKKLDDLEKQLKPDGPVDEELVERHKNLSDELIDSEKKSNKIEAELRDVALRLTDLSAKQASLRTDYATEFSKRVKKHSSLSSHPLVVASLGEGICGLCDASGAEVIRELQQRCSGSNCPLCGSAIDKRSSGAPADGMKRLKNIDQELVLVSGQLQDAVDATRRLNRDLEGIKAKIGSQKNELEEFESANKRALAKLQSESSKGSIGAVLDAYREQMEEFLKEKERHYAKRNEKRREYLRLRENLDKQYRAGEEVFVPLFTELAASFLGLDLSIRLDPGAVLVLEVKSSVRREQHQLSESQRFFIDIALRMALVRFMSASNERACLFVDTPEGSLDIAYESRAGDMLAMFVESGHNVVMTANINTSKLLLSMASACGKERMHVSQMTSWAELSDVQRQESKLFKDAYQEIEKALSSGGKRARAN